MARAMRMCAPFVRTPMHRCGNVPEAMVALNQRRCGSVPIMRIPMTCSECSREEIEAEQRADEESRARGETVPERRGGRSFNPENWFLSDIEEDNAYVDKCPRGHEMKMTLQISRYELLYESGIVAMLVGFQREAVSSIAAALERFYEFAIEVFSLRFGIDGPTHEDAWKHVKKQSERQLGAFLFLFLVNFRRPFLTGKALAGYEKMSGFRNDVIHQGKFPSASETIDFARYVFELIRDQLAALKGLDADAVRKAELRYYREGHAAVEAKAGPPKPDKNGMYRGASGASFVTMLSTIVTNAPTDFDSRLAESKSNLDLWGFADRG